jgi:DNA topoisomerase-2
MPLKGKVLNVRQTSNKVLSDNQEILNLCNALGLDFTMTYETSLKGLRYGKVMLMTDQDHDGSHIKGLVINFFHHFWPALLQQHSFLQQFITPLVKVTRDQQVFSFYSLQEFNQWMQAQNSASTLRVKYYKGLGTSTAQEAKEYFKALDRHRKDFSSNGNEHEVMELAFAKDKASDRRQWIQETFRPDTFIDPHSPTVSFEDFVHKELIHFSYADNLRSIPSVVDGLKPSQRKVLYACFKKRLSAEIKVVQLAGFCAEQTCYHHGEAALHACIINMAQDFVGSNNIPLLVPSGQFGTRFQGGKDFASPRYLFTRLSPITRMIFPEVDDSLLELQVEDGMEVEPKHFVPIIPMLLVNGTQGIGTGWSTNIPSYNPLDIIERIRCRLLGVPEPAKALTPWIRGFKGRIFKEAPRTGTQSYTTRGVIQRSRPTQLSVTELPVGSWIADYKIFLNTLIVAGIIKEYREAHTARHVRFDILATAVSVEGLEKVGLHKVFQLNTFLHTSNMHAFTPDQKIHKFTQPEEILDTFFPLRMNLYAHRKQMLQADLLFQTRVDTNRARFVNEICKGTIKLVGKAGGVPRQQLEALLFKLGFEPMEKLTTMRNAGCSVRRNVVPSRNTFEYLLDMPIHSLTQERSARLHQAATQSQVALEALERTTAQEMWLKELADLEKKLQSQLDDEIHY